MKLAATSLAFALAAMLGASAYAADATPPAKTLTPQQQKMSDCAKDAHAKGLKGDDYKTYMSTCMKADSATPAAPAAPAKPMTQQEKMKACNADASSKQLKGDDRKTFMSTCLKGDSATPAAAH